MPSLTNIVIAGNSTDAYKPVYKGYGVWDIIYCDNGGSLAAQTTSADTMHFTMALNAIDYYLVVTGVDTIVGAGNCAVCPAIWEPSGTHEILLNILNVSGSNQTATANNIVGRMALIKKQDFKITISNPV